MDNERLAETRAWARRDRRIAVLVGLLAAAMLVGGIWQAWPPGQ